MGQGIRDKAFWERICAEYWGGGRSRAEVAAKYGVKLCTLSYHLYSGHKSPSRRKKSKQRFLPVKVATTPARPAMIELASRGGEVVRAEVGADPDYLAQLMKALRD